MCIFGYGYGYKRDATNEIRHHSKKKKIDDRAKLFHRIKVDNYQNTCSNFFLLLFALLSLICCFLPIFSTYICDCECCVFMSLLIFSLFHFFAVNLMRTHVIENKTLHNMSAFHTEFRSEPAIMLDVLQIQRKKIVQQN